MHRPWLHRTRRLRVGWRRDASAAAGLGLLGLVLAVWLAAKDRNLRPGGSPSGAPAPSSERLAPPTTQPRRTSGALAAFDFWARSRAYPEHVVSGERYSRAFERAQALPAAPEPIDAGTRKAPPGYRSRWRALGPANVGGRTLAIAFNPQNPSTIWAGSAGGGLWRSTTQGRGASAWEYVSTGHPVLAVSSIAFAPGDSSTLYVGTGEVYGYQDARGGVHVRVTRGSYGIGILKSSDGGRSWRRSLDWARFQQRGVQAVRVDPGRPRRGWAATTEGIYRSDDAGASWTQVLGVIMAMDLEVHPTRGDTVYAACGNFYSEGRGVYRTHDGGATWTRLAKGWPADFGGMIRLALAPTDPQVIYASVGNGFEDDIGSWLLRSGDGGESWSIRSTVDHANYQGWYSHDVVVDPTNSDRVFFCGIDIWRSDAGGAAPVRISNWRAGFDGVIQPGESEGQPNYSHADHHALAFHPSDPLKMYVANDGGVTRTVDGGVTFENCNGGYQTCQFYNGFSSANTDSVPAIGGLQDNGSVIYEGSAAWRRVIGGDGGWTAIEPGNPEWMYGTTQYLAVYRSASGGATFLEHSPPVASGAAFIAPIVVSPASAATLFAASDVIFRSPDRAETWATGAVVNGQSVICLAASARRVGTLYAGTVPDAAGRTVFRSTDGGQSWREASLGLPDRYAMDLAIDPGNDQVVYAVFGGYGSPHVFRTASGGLAWEDIGGGLPDVPTSAVAWDPRLPGTLYVGNDIGVFATQDGGATWFHLREGLPDALLCTDLSIQALYRKLRVATHGNGVFERSLLSGASDLPPTQVVALHQNRPNPFNPSTTIAFSLQRIARVSLAVYDVRGRRVRTLLDDVVTLPGDHELQWDGTDDARIRVASGSYVCRIDVDEDARSVMMTLIE